MKRSALHAILVLSLVVWATAAWAQTGEGTRDLQKEIEALKAGQKKIENELREIKEFLQRRFARREAVETVNLTIDIAGAPVKGDSKAPLTIVEFSDYECPFCGRFVRQTAPLIDKEYIQTGKVRYVFRNFPLSNIHKNAMKAAESAHCAGEQGKYWPMHDRLFAHQRKLHIAQLPDHATAIGLNIDTFNTCLTSDKYARRVRRDLMDGARAGVRGTPTFFVGYTGTDAKQIQGIRRIVGAHPFPRFQQAFEQLLREKKN